VVENTGDRPARDIAPVVEDGDLEAAQHGAGGSVPSTVLRIFCAQPVIPVLAKGRQMSTATGTWDSEDAGKRKRGYPSPSFISTLTAAGSKNRADYCWLTTRDLPKGFGLRRRTHEHITRHRRANAFGVTGRYGSSMPGLLANALPTTWL